MHGAFFAQDLLRARDPQIVDPRPAMMCETGPPARAAQGRERHAARPAVQVQAQCRPPGTHGAHRRVHDAVDVRIVFENTGEAFLHHYRQAQVRSRAFEHLNGGRGQHAVPQ